MFGIVAPAHENPEEVSRYLDSLPVEWIQHHDVEVLVVDDHTTTIGQSARMLLGGGLWGGLAWWLLHGDAWPVGIFAAAFLGSNLGLWRFIAKQQGVAFLTAAIPLHVMFSGCIAAGACLGALYGIHDFAFQRSSGPEAALR